jgi:hypothetical protein
MFKRFLFFNYIIDISATVKYINKSKHTLKLKMPDEKNYFTKMKIFQKELSIL